jgi:NAD(P)-dependent dehydrogenase (short-subunit alcohol dehydrogenase family)
MLLSSKVILVAGVTGGLGHAVASVLSSNGATIIALGRERARMDSVLGSLCGEGHRSVECDFREPGRVPDAVRAIGIPLDGLAYLAGIDETLPLAVLSQESMEDIFKVNVFSAAMMCKSVSLQGVMAKSGGSVVIVSSVMGIVGSPGRAVYSASKAALIGLIKSASLECARRRVRVNAVLPGYIETPMTRNQQKALSDQQIDRIRAMHPLGIGMPVDVANTVLFLLSNYSSWITGTSIVVDGGYSAS